MTQETKWINVQTIAQDLDARMRALPDLKAGHVRPIRREFTKRLAHATPQQVLELAQRLITTFERRLVAYELVHYHRPTLYSLRVEELEALSRGMDSWSSVDAFGLLLAGPAWREKQVPDAWVHGWARSEDYWRRRAALVCTVALNVKARGGSGDVPRTLHVCRMLADDRDDMVIKAMSWALRVLIQHDPQAVRDFLAEHEDALAARVKREVQNKLTTGLKNPRRSRPDRFS